MSEKFTNNIPYSESGQSFIADAVSKASRRVADDFKKKVDEAYEKGKADALKCGEPIQMREYGSVERVFPRSKQVGACAISEGGLTKREYFAAMAMQGLLAADIRADMRKRANIAVSQADELIKELEKSDDR